MRRELHHENFFRVQAALITCVSEAAYALDEQQMYHSVCYALVRSELFQLAWFGYPAGNEGKVGEPVASSGDKDGYFEDLKLALKSDDYEDPATIAIRTGDTYWIKDIINGGAIIDHEAPRERRFVAVEK